MEVYKVLGPNGQAHHGGKGKWPLPTKCDDGWTPGEWLSVTPPIIPCAHGLHLCRRQDLVTWLGPMIYRAEYEGDMVEGDGKIVVSRARLLAPVETWNDRTAGLFACDCAAHVLQYWERYYPDDKRPHEAIEVARRFARGDATWQQMAEAAWAAARAAAWAAEAAWAARAEAAEAAEAARAAAEAAAEAERAWQTERLFEYLDNKEATDGK